MAISTAQNDVDAILKAAAAAPAPAPVPKTTDIESAPVEAVPAVDEGAAPQVDAQPATPQAPSVPPANAEVTAASAETSAPAKSTTGLSEITSQEAVNAYVQASNDIPVRENEVTLDV